ncbi:hypothetical protein L3Q82_011243, partial [Scortum barcoo]
PRERNYCGTERNNNLMQDQVQRPVLLEGAEVEAVDFLQIPRAVAGQ